MQALQTVVQIVQGNSYIILWDDDPDDPWPSNITEKVTFYIAFARDDIFAQTCTYPNGTTVEVQVELNAVQTAAMPVGVYTYYIQARRSSGAYYTLVTGLLEVYA